MTTPSNASVNDPQPDSPGADRVASASDRIRLGCRSCDRDDFDGVEVIPADWTDVISVQSWEESMRPVEDDSEPGRSALDWQTHTGICPDCQEEGDTVDRPANDSPEEPIISLANEADDREFREAIAVDPILRQIIDRDCHVGESDRNVVRHVISRLRNGYETFRTLSQTERQQFIAQCLSRHRANRRQYVEVMSGFTRTLGREPVTQGSMTGREIVALMRQHWKTIAQLAFRLGTSQQRVRQARTLGLRDPLAVRDWIEAITGQDPGPIPQRCGKNRSEATECGFCGLPLDSNSDAYEYVGDVFCSIHCCRASRGW